MTRSRITALALAVALVAACTTPGWAQKSNGGSVLPGGNSGKPINIEAVKLDYFDKEQKLIYTGNVVAKQGDSTLHSSVLTIFLAPKGSAAPGAGGTNQVQRMYATGPVTMTQRDQIGTGDNAVYNRLTNNVIMTGNVTLSQGPNVTKGDKLTYDLKTGQAVVTGRVKSMFIPGSGSTTSSDSAPAEESGGKGRRAASGR
jgi:lipopolysaccharide export system protein LptA